MSSTLPKKLASVTPGSLYAGVDLALDSNVVVVLNAKAQQLARFRFSNDRAGYDEFYQRLARVCEQQQASGVLVGMEPTNYYWKLLAADLEEHQYAYRLVNPYTVKKHREGDQLDRSKDDWRDAFTIGDLLRTGKFTTTRLLHGDYAELRQYATLYDRLGQAVRRQMNLIRATGGQLFPEALREFKAVTGATALAMLRQHAAASLIRDMAWAAFVTGVRQDFAGKRLHLSKLRRVYALAQQSVGLQEGVHSLQLTLRVQIDSLQALLAQREEAAAALQQAFLAMPEARYLLSLPGLGTLTAAIILSEIGDPSHYSQGRQWVKLAGTQPVPNSSGRKSRSKTPMSHKGRPRLRTALFFG
jgi:transposase